MNKGGRQDTPQAEPSQSQAIAEFKTGVESVRERHFAGASGLEVVRRLSDEVDKLVRRVWSEVATADGPCALVALGGYGRGELSPSSDVDLIFLHEKGVNVESGATLLAYRLWDAGLELGHAIYTPKQALNLAYRHFDTHTAFLQARLIEGDKSLFDAWHETHLARARRDERGFTQKLRSSVQARRAVSGDASAELEPNLKEGRGGLRDINALQWSGLVSQGDPALDEQIVLAMDLLLKVRNQLHFMTGRRTDVLLVQHQAEVANALLGGTRGVSAEDELMRLLYDRCRSVASRIDSKLFYEPASDELAQRFSQDAGVFPWRKETRKAFFEILSQGARARRAFEAIQQNQSMVRAIPEWSNIYCRPQRNVYHRWAVDVHSFEVVAQLASMLGSEDTLVREVARDTRDQWHTLLLAGLLHDIGKGADEDHSRRGARLASQALERIGVEESEKQDILWLVENHLLLSETAARRDLSDESLIIEVAEGIGSQSRLRMLYLLSIADAVATGPHAWSPWKSALLSHLFAEVNHLLEQDELAGKNASEMAREKLASLQEALPHIDKLAITSHVSKMPRAWLLSQPVEALVQQSDLLMNYVAAAGLSLHARPLREAGVWEVVVVAGDRPGLFGKICGCLVLHGLNVLDAQVFTREGGVGLEIFRVEALSDEERRFDSVANDARRALEGRLELESMLGKKQRDYSARPNKGKREPPRVIVDNQTSDFYTIVEVHATDRMGLLYNVSASLADLKLDIHIAKVSTYGEDVVDVFYVRDLEGQRVDEEAQANIIKESILRRIASVYEAG